MVAVRCPHDLDTLMRKTGGVWEPGSRRRLIERRRINPLVRNLRRATDPLFRQAPAETAQRGRGQAGAAPAGGAGGVTATAASPSRRKTTGPSL